MTLIALIVEIDSHRAIPNFTAEIDRFCSNHIVFSIESALAKIDELLNLDVLVLNIPSIALTHHFRAKFPLSTIVLVTDLTMKEYATELSGNEHVLLDHIVLNTRSQWTANQLTVTLSKLHTRSIFGVEQYLAPNTQIHRCLVKSSGEREEINEAVKSFTESQRLGHLISRLSYDISEELTMNALYDAPYAARVPRFHQGEYPKVVTLEPEEYGELRYAYDGQTFIISCSDPFGALKKETFFTYMKKVLKRGTGEPLIDKKEGGAGLGLFKVLYSSHGIICNVKPQSSTEIIAIIDTKTPLKDFAKTPRSIQFFEVQNPKSISL